MLRTTDAVIKGIIQHARTDAPVEACGYLAEKDGVVDQYHPMTNADRSTDHFTLVPQEQFDTVRRIRASGRRLRAVYHSHPESPARMSAEDLRLAHDPSLSYVIVSLAQREPDIKSYRIGPEGLCEEPVTKDMLMPRTESTGGISPALEV